MARGILYVMTTVVPGLVKIGKTGITNFEQRMYNLEHNGYSNVVGLKRHFAIEVDDYDEKETLLHTIFSKSQVENTELFALDINLVVQLLSSFEGNQIFPQGKPKEEVFDEATSQRDIRLIPEGEYHLERKIKRWNNRSVKGIMHIKNGRIIVKKGSVICPLKGAGFKTISIIDKKRKEAKIIDNVLQENVEFNSPSLGASFVLYGPANGWTEWKTADGKPIDIYRRDNNRGKNNAKSKEGR
ncbi:MAG: DUF4357 domain-containing protein [Erysipelotrichaceae bacterium]|nr:DUF4357 domain-containing protein [Erysipelotrichaceae bacterium]